MKQKKNTKFRQWLPYKIVIEKNGSKIRVLHLLLVQLEIPVAGYGLQVTGCRLRVAGTR